MRFIGLTCTLALLAVACDSGDDHHYHYSNEPVAPIPAPVAASIDTDAQLAGLIGGQGAGAFAEYVSGGTWRIYTGCDYDLSLSPCDWDVVASPTDGVIYDVLGEDDEADDLISTDRARSYARLQALTVTDFDGMLVQTNPGVGLTLDVWLDGVPAPELVFWMSDGTVNPGAPSNPIELVPTAP
jgi:hypothetical protein